MLVAHDPSKPQLGPRLDEAVDATNVSVTFLSFVSVYFAVSPPNVPMVTPFQYQCCLTTNLPKVCHSYPR